MQKINALVCAVPGDLTLVERDMPVRRPGDVLVRPRRIGICGTDYHIFQGKHPFLEYPRVMGHELAVEIVEAPASSKFVAGEICSVNPYLSCGQCRTCRAGRPNCCVNISVLGVHQDGGMAELFAFPAENLVKADELSPDACAVVEFLAIGAHAVRRGAPRPGDSILVVGAGPIGLGVALFARLSGAQVDLMDLDEMRASSVASIAGVSTCASSEAREYDLVFDATGSRPAMERSFDYVAGGGTYVMVGVAKDNIEFSDPDFHRKEMTLKGSRNATSEDFEQVIEAIRRGNVNVDRIITHRTSLAGAVHDLAAWATDNTGLIKAVIEVD